MWIPCFIPLYSPLNLYLIILWILDFKYILLLYILLLLLTRIRYIILNILYTSICKEEFLVNNYHYITDTSHCRSILNVIQERQDQQSRDLAILKDTLTDLAVQQQRDSSVLETLMSQSSNTDWAVADLKTSQDHLTDDVMIIKG